MPFDHPSPRFAGETLCPGTLSSRPSRHSSYRVPPITQSGRMRGLEAAPGVDLRLMH